MQTLTEKRVYGEQGGARSCFVASDTGLVHVRVTGTAVGEFSLVDRRSARDVAVGPPPRPDDGRSRAADPHGTTLAVAAASDVLVGSIPAPSDSDSAPAAVEPSLEPAGFGPAVAVDLGPEGIVAASADGELRRAALADGITTDDGSAPLDGEWRSIEGPTDLSIRAVDAPLVATDGGVFRVVDGRLRPAGLQDCRDVDATDDPLAATPRGLYALGNGWQSLLDVPTEAVSVADAAAWPDRPRTHAVSAASVYAVDGSAEPIATAEDSLVDLTHGEPGHVYAIATDGTVLAAGPDDVRRHPLGVRGAAAIAALRY